MQNSLFPELDCPTIINKWRVSAFSADNLCEDKERCTLENKYWDLVEITDKFDRKSVSFQLSKNDVLHSWLKYKEGFSADLVRRLINEFNLPNNALILDPFMGSGTTGLVAAFNGMSSIGFDILPMSDIAIKAKIEVFNYDLTELDELSSFIASHYMPDDYEKETPFITITQNGYPPKNAKEIQFFSELIDNSNFSNRIKTLYTLCALNCLEKASYSAKDGQYLRWDFRSPKIVHSAKMRELKNKKPLVVRLDKGDIPSFKECIFIELQNVIEDIKAIQKLSGTKPSSNTCKFIEGSALFELPLIESNSINAVISSPPYCNRYDYTRTYALELAYLGVSDTTIKKLRQNLLSCTVENKPKIETLRTFYTSIGRVSDFNWICHIIQSCLPLKESINALKIRALNGEINNKGILSMVENYFTELTFLFFEIFRVCRSGAHIAFVNDNVRYAGEVIPVDFITTELAHSIGFKPKKIYVLRQQKGNSSQQMKKYGRIPLRKSITIWEK